MRRRPEYLILPGKVFPTIATRIKSNWTLIDLLYTILDVSASGIIFLLLSISRV
jgi:hypothetical protein